MGDLIVEKNGVKGDAKDIALLFKETGVDLGQFLKKDSNTNRPTNVPGWVCIVLFVVLCIICGAIYIVPIENIWVNMLKFASVCICAILIFCIYCFCESWSKTGLASILLIVILIIGFQLLSPEKTIELAKDTAIEYIKQK